MLLSLIVATDAANGVGYKNTLPWPHSAKDMRWFQEKTQGKVVVMGRKTWQSLPVRPLAGRTNVVVSRTSWQGADLCLDPKEPIDALLAALEDVAQGREVVLIGGPQLYALFAPFVSRSYLTRFKQMYTCDTYLNITPELSRGSKRWQEVFSEDHEELHFSILELTWN